MIAMNDNRSNADFNMSMFDGTVQTGPPRRAANDKSPPRESDDHDDDGVEQETEDMFDKAETLPEEGGD